MTMIPQVLSQGPVLLLILAPVLTWCHQRHQDHEEEVRKTSVRVSSSPLPSDQIPSLGFTLSLAATWLPCYALNLVISELYIMDSFAFLLVKEQFTEYKTIILSQDTAFQLSIALVASYIVLERA